MVAQDIDTWGKKKEEETMIVLDMKKLRNGSRDYYTALINWGPLIWNK